MKTILSLVLLFVCVSLSSAEDRNTIIRTGSYDEKEMNAAIVRARKEMDKFIQELGKPQGENHSIKVAITNKGETEYFWLNPVTYRNGVFEGQINNEPGIVKNVRFGDKRKVKKDQVVDWLYMRDGKMYGNYTVRPLMKAMPKDEVEWLRGILVEP